MLSSKLRQINIFELSSDREEILVSLYASIHLHKMVYRSVVLSIHQPATPPGFFKRFRATRSREQSYIITSSFSYSINIVGLISLVNSLLNIGWSAHTAGLFHDAVVQRKSLERWVRCKIDHLFMTFTEICLYSLISLGRGSSGDHSHQEEFFFLHMFFLGSGPV